MKKVSILVLMSALAASTAFAATTKETLKTESAKWGSFWSREGERSGLKESTSSWGNFFKNVNPGKFFKDQQDAYNARKGNTVS